MSNLEAHHIVEEIDKHLAHVKRLLVDLATVKSSRLDDVTALIDTATKISNTALEIALESKS